MRMPARQPALSLLAGHMLRRHLGMYVLSVGVPVLAILLLIRLGGWLFGAAETHATVSAANDSHPLFHILVALTAILVAGRVCGGLFARMGQPRVLGEIVAGIALGPSLLGWLSPGLASTLISPSALSALEVVGNLGLILFMFQVGLEFDFDLIRRKGHVALLVSHSSICLPFLGGVGLGLLLYPLRYSDSVPFLPFTLFMGLAMSVTAFPVLTRILRDRGMAASPLGTLALACAAADDITAWCLLAALLGISNSSAAGGMATFGMAIMFCVFMGAIVRPLARRFSRSHAWSSLPTILLGLLSSALVAEWIGIHAFFGAFLFGLCVPRQAAATASIRSKIEALTISILLPAFFVTSGLRTSLDTLGGWDGWLVCGIVVAVATAGKLVGTVVPARVAGLPWHESITLGVLMNTRGLMEIVIANVGLQCGIIPPEMFTVLVVMAVVTTFASGPLLRALERTGDASQKRRQDQCADGLEKSAELSVAVSDRNSSAFAGGNS